MWVLQGQELRADAHHPVASVSSKQMSSIWNGAGWGAVFAEWLLPQEALGCPHVTLVSSASSLAEKWFTLAATCHC